MNRYVCGAVLIAALIAAGCAVAPAEPAEDGRAATTGAAATDSIADAAEEGASTLVVDATGPPPVRCREMLKQGSNVIVTYCMTLADWERFERRQARDAQAVVRTLQGGAFR
jgi:hypothetical protein